MSSESPSVPLSGRRSRKIILTSWIAASIEWYDFFIYGIAAALVFPKLFFPSTEPLVGTFLSFATFGVAFVARPLGGILFGHFGDTLGRKRALVTALTATGVVTTLIGLLPTYSSIGLAAPILLVVLRFVQGIAIGGQQGGVILLATENAPPHRRGFLGSFASAGAPGGVILANLAFLLVAALMPAEDFQAWGWRIPFLASVALVVVAVMIQLRLEETTQFRAATAAPEPVRRRSPVLRALREHPREIVLIAGCYLAINLTYYLFITFVVAYVSNPKILGMSQREALTAVLIASVVELIALPVAGWLSDVVGRRVVYGLGALLLAGWSFVFWPLVDSGSFVLLTLALIVGLGLLNSMMYGPQPAMFSELFSTQVRYSGLSLGVQLGSVLGGAFAPLLATALLASWGSSTPIAVYMAAGCLVTFACTLLLGRLRPAMVDQEERAPAVSADRHA